MWVFISSASPNFNSRLIPHLDHVILNFKNISSTVKFAWEKKHLTIFFSHCIVLFSKNQLKDHDLLLWIHLDLKTSREIWIPVRINYIYSRAFLQDLAALRRICWELIYRTQSLHSVENMATECFAMENWIEKYCSVNFP